MLRLIDALAYAARPSPPLRLNRAPSLDSLERLGEFLVDAFLVSLFVGLLTVAALHLLRPVIRKTAQSLSLNRTAHLPPHLRKQGMNAFRRERDRPKAQRYSIVSALAGLAGLTPEWMDEAAGRWSFVARVRWARRSARQFRLLDQLGGEHPRRVLLTKRAFAARSTFLSDELFMRTIANEAKAVVTRPSQNPYLFMLVAARAPDDARAVVARFEALAETDPGCAAALTRVGNRNIETDSGEGGEKKNVAAGIIAAQNAVATATEGWLDQFQLGLASQSLIVTRLFAIGAGLAFAAIAGRYVSWQGPSGLLSALGVSGGLIGLLANDAVLAWAARRR